MLSNTASLSRDERVMPHASTPSTTRNSNGWVRWIIRASGVLALSTPSAIAAAQDLPKPYVASPPARSSDAVKPPDTPKPKDAGQSDVWTQAELERVSEEIRHQVEDMRGMKYKLPVAVKITDKKGFFDYAKKRQDETVTPERTKRDITVAKLLGLVPVDMDLEQTMLALLEDQVGGFYDPGSNTFFLMDSFTGGVAKIILAHELTHALDDQYFDIDGTLKKANGETDAELAFQAVIEGSGTGLMNQWYLKNASAVSMEDLQRAQSMGGDKLESAPPYLWKPLLAVYLRGDGFLAHADGMNLTMKAASTDDIRAAMSHPPRSTEQILHPKKYWDEGKRDEPKSIAIDVKSAPAGWTLLGEDTLGELYLAMLTTPVAERGGLDAANPMSILGIRYTNKSAEGWGGDRLALFGRGEDRMLELVTCWDTAKDADEFAHALGDAKKPTAIPVFSSADRGPAAGWEAGYTATDAVVTRETAADGTTACVVLRVFSFAQREKEVDVTKLLVPWKLAATK